MNWKGVVKEPFGRLKSGKNPEEKKMFSGSLFLLAELVKGAKQILTQEHRFFWSNNP
jgi:hypothetical protein